MGGGTVQEEGLYSGISDTAHNYYAIHAPHDRGFHVILQIALHNAICRIVPDLEKPTTFSYTEILIPL